MQILLLTDTKNKAHSELEKALTERGHEIYRHGRSGGEGGNFWENYQESRNLVISADAVIADESALAPNVQSTLALALEYKKPTLLTVPRQSDVVDQLLGLRHPHLTIQTYQNKTELEKDVLGFIEKVKDSLDAKMFMVIPPTVNKYLEWIVANTSKTKSDVVRAAVDDVAEKDKEYQDFLKRRR